MKRFALIFAGILLIPLNVLHSQTWELEWSDDFDYEGLPDSTKWSYDVGGGGWGNAELQYYTDKRAKNARVDGQHLIIEAHKESGFGRDYTSARLVSRGKGDWKYGRIEVRAKLPAGRGTWPAIWMLPTASDHGNHRWPDTGEIDIMEHVGHNPTTIYATVHTNKYNHVSNTHKGGQIRVETFSEIFHTYAAEWSPETIEFSVDGTVFFRFHDERRGWPYWPFDRQFHLLLNIAIGGSWGGQQGVDDSIFPQQMVIDYVRVYQNSGVPVVALAAPISVQPGEPVVIRAEVSDPDGDLVDVRFLQGDGTLATIDMAPFALSIHDAQRGCYVLGAEATDAGGWYKKAEAVRLRVGDTCGQAPYLIAPHSIPGKIEAEYFDLGGRGTGYGDISAENNGGGIRKHEGVDIERFADSNDQGYAVTDIQRREWLKYTVRVAHSGSYTMEARIASSGPKAVFDIEIDDAIVVDAFEHRTRSVAPRWESAFLGGIMLEEGLHTMRVRMQSSDFKLDWLGFNLDSPTFTEPDLEGGSSSALINHPNPFSDATRLRYYVPSEGHVVLDLFDVLGRHITTLIDAPHARGVHDASLSGYDLSAGVYHVLLRSIGHVQTRTIVVMHE